MHVTHGDRISCAAMRTRQCFCGLHVVCMCPVQCLHGCMLLAGTGFLQLHVVVVLDISCMRHCFSVLVQVRCSCRHLTMWLWSVWLWLSQFALFLNEVCSLFPAVGTHAVHHSGTVSLAWPCQFEQKQSSVGWSGGATCTGRSNEMYFLSILWALK